MAARSIGPRVIAELAVGRGGGWLQHQKGINSTASSLETPPATRGQHVSVMLPAGLAYSFVLRSTSFHQSFYDFPPPGVPCSSKYLGAARGNRRKSLVLFAARCCVFVYFVVDKNNVEREKLKRPQCSAFLAVSTVSSGPRVSCLTSLSIKKGKKRQRPGDSSPCFVYMGD